MAKEKASMDELLIEEAEHLIDTARAEGMTIRLVGSIGFRELCSEYQGVHRTVLEREIGDIDLIGYKSESDKIQSFFDEQGYEVDKDILLSGWGNRLVMYGKKGGQEYEVDIFLDEMNMCHKLDVSNRLETGPSNYGLNPSDLFLEKAQIVEINEKDLKDILTLCLEFPVSTSDDEINKRYISKRLAKDWGFYYTVTNNLTKAREYLRNIDGLHEADTETVRHRLDELEQSIESTSKSIRWHLRSLVGTHWKWYSAVDKKHR